MDCAASLEFVCATGVYLDDYANVDCSHEPDFYYRAAEYCCGCLCHDAGFLFNVSFVPSAAPVAPSTTQSTVLTVTPVTADLNAKTYSTSVVTKASSRTRVTSRRRKTEPNSMRSQQYRAAREQPTVVAPIVIVSPSETHTTVLTTENTAAASTAVSSILNLITAAENKLMRGRADQVKKFAYVH